MTRRTCDELGVCQGHSTPCSGCSSHKACPCPQACEVPAPDADPLHDKPATRTEIALMCIAIAAVAVVLLFTIKSCAIA